MVTLLVPGKKIPTLRLSDIETRLGRHIAEFGDPIFFLISFANEPILS